MVHVALTLCFTRGANCQLTLPGRLGWPLTDRYNQWAYEAERLLETGGFWGPAVWLEPLVAGPFPGAVGDLKTWAGPPQPAYGGYNSSRSGLSLTREGRLVVCSIGRTRVRGMIRSQSRIVLERPQATARRS